MGLLKAGLGALGGTLADQWKEFFVCESLPDDVLMVKGEKRVGKRSSNTKGTDNIISNGSVITVANGQAMMIVEQGKVVEFSAEPGEFVWDSSTEPSIFTGSLGKGILDTFKSVGKRFTFGGEPAKDQRVYYFNTKLIMDNKFGTPTPIMFEVVNKRMNMARTVNLRCNGTYTYVISDPMLFYARLAGNVSDVYRRDKVDAQLKADFIDALQPAIGALSELELRPGQLPAKAKELKAAMNSELTYWTERGISIDHITLNPITLTPEDMKKINELEDAMTLGSNPQMMAGRMVDSNARAMEAAANNSAGAMTGFMGMGMAGNMMGGSGFNAAQSFYQMGQQQAAQQPAQQPAAPAAAPAAPAADSWTCSCGATATGKFCPECGSKKPEPKPAADSWTCSCGTVVTGKFCPECGSKKPDPKPEGWTCSCGAVNKGKFCAECGAKKPEGVPQYRCDKCGWEPADPTKPPKFCPECGDPFDDGDIKR